MYSLVRSDLVLVGADLRSCAISGFSRIIN